MADNTDEIIYYVFLSLEIVLSVVALGVLWRRPVRHPPHGIETTTQTDIATFAQLSFLPLIMFNLTSYFVDPNTSDILPAEAWGLRFPLLLALFLVEAILYWPVHISIGSDDLIDRIAGAILILLSIADDVTTIIVYGYRIVDAISFYVPHFLYSVAALVWLAYPSLFGTVFTTSKNRKLLVAYHLSAVSLLLLGSAYLQQMLDILDVFKEILAAFLEEYVDMDPINEIIDPFEPAVKAISYFAAVTTYVAIMAANFYSYRKFGQDEETTIREHDLLDIEVARFTFVGVFVGYQITAFTLLFFTLWSVSFIIYQFPGEIWNAFLSYFVAPFIVVLVLNESVRAIVGFWLYGLKYRPFPRKLQIPLVRSEFNIYWSHFEYFVLFYSMLLGFFSFIGRRIGSALLKLFLLSVIPNPNGTSTIDIGFKKRGVAFDQVPLSDTTGTATSDAIVMQSLNSDPDDDAETSTKQSVSKAYIKSANPFEN